MNALKTLVIMQFKEKMNLKSKKIAGKNSLFALVFGILKFGLIVALCFLILFLCRYLQLFSLVGTIPSSVITVAFTVMMIISIVAATMSLNKSMYYSYDNPVLLTLPCKPRQVYLSKLIVFYIYELLRNMNFIVPLFVALGIINGYSFAYYPWMLFCFIFISMIPVLIGAILSIPTMWFYNFFRQYKRLQLVTFIIVVLGVVYGVVSAIALIPSNIDLIGTWGTTFWKIQEFLTNFQTNFKLFDKLVTMMVGVRVNLVNVLFTLPTLKIFGYLILAIIGLFFIGMFTSEPLFYKMASKPFEYRKSVVKAKPNKSLSKTNSIMKTELLLNVRNPERLFTNVALCAAMPIAIFFLNKMFAAMNTRMLGNNMAISFNVLIILLIALSSNYYAASVFSRDGRSSYLIKVQPSRYQPLLISKLLFNLVFMLIAFVATLSVLISYTQMGTVNAVLIILSTTCIYLAHLFYSAELDVMNPQTELYATIGNSDNNPNETKSTVIAFLVSFVTFGVLLFLLVENSGVVTYIKIALLAIVAMLFRLYMLLNKIKLYYKEK